MNTALLAKRPGVRAARVAAIREAAKGPVIHLHPKGTEPSPIAGVLRTTYEEINDRDTWLRINALVGPETTVVLEKPTRYPKISSPKFQHLYRLCQRAPNAHVVDIVPFTLDIKYLYTTYCYLGREILGYPHYYAFRENYEEVAPDGRVVHCHDHDILAAKIAPVTDIDYAAFLCPSREVASFTSTAAEHAEYQARREELFEKETNPARIVTRLADTAHAFSSRTAALIDLLAGLDEPATVFVNLNSYATRINQAIRKAGLRRHRCVSYQLGQPEPTPVTVYAESPIVKSYLLLDAEAAVPKGGRVYHLLGDTKVDQYLFGRIQGELAQIDSLTKEIAKCKSP